MLADSAVTYTSVHSEARSWSIPSEDPYEEAARQLLEQAPRSPEYVPEDHVPVYIPEPEHPEDLDAKEFRVLPHDIHDAQKDHAAVRAEIAVLETWVPIARRGQRPGLQMVSVFSISSLYTGPWEGAGACLLDTLEDTYVQFLGRLWL
ncbi:hypothetical protein Tco_1371360 [Tanacetum coccineum]